MVKIELTKEETEMMISMIEQSSVKISFASKALILYKKFKEAKVI